MKKLILPIVLIVGITMVLGLVSAYSEDINGDEDKIVYTASAFQGWNILNGGLYTLSQITSQSDIKKEDIVAIFYYSPSKKQFIRIHPSLEDKKFQDEEDYYGSDRSPIYSSSVRVYIKRDGMIQYETDDMIPTSQRNLKIGWNFISVTQGALGNSLNDLKGNCDIQKAYYYFREYKELDLNMKLPNDMASHGLLIKVGNDCSFVDDSSDGGISPPKLPGNGGAATSGTRETGYVEETTKCEDSDGNNKNILGAISYHSNRSLYDNTFTDWCDYNYWNEKMGVSNRVGVVQEGVCEGNSIFKILAIKCDDGYVCRNGACIQGDSSLAICSDSDGGKVISQKGKVSGDRSGGEDYCFDKSLNGGQGGSTSTCSGANCFVYEFTCAQNEDSSAELIACSKGCNDGACVQ